MATAFAGDDNFVGSAERLAAETGIHQAVIGDTEPDIVLDERIEDRIRNLIAHLVRVAFRDGLAGEEIIGVWH